MEMVRIFVFVAFYVKYSHIGEFAAATVRYFKQSAEWDHVANQPEFGESNVGYWKKIVQNYMKEQKYPADAFDRVQKWPGSGGGRPTIIAPGYEQEIDWALQTVSDAGGSVSLTICVATMLVVMEDMAPESLVEHGGEILICRSLAKSFLHRHKYVQRRKTQDKAHCPPNMEELKNEHIRRFTTLLNKYNTPPCLIHSADEVGHHIFPERSTTLAKKGAKQVKSAAIKNKEQVTKMNCIGADGRVLPTRIIFRGKTDRVYPRGIKPTPEFSFDHAPRHFQTTETMLRWCDLYIEEIQRIRRACADRAQSNEDKAAALQQQAILLLDNHSTHLADAVLQKLHQARVHVEFLPPNTTAFLQACDVNFNSLEKAIVQELFQQWLNGQYLSQLDRHRKEMREKEATAARPITSEEKRVQLVDPIPKDAASKRAFIARLLLRAHYESKARCGKSILKAFNKVGLYSVIYGKPFVDTDMMESPIIDDAALNWDDVIIPELDILHHNDQVMNNIRKGNFEEDELSIDYPAGSDDEDSDMEVDDDEAFGAVDNVDATLEDDAAKEFERRLDALEAGAPSPVAPGLEHSDGKLRVISTDAEMESLLQDDPEVQVVERGQSRSRSTRTRASETGWATAMLSFQRFGDEHIGRATWESNKVRMPATDVLKKHGNLALADFCIIEEDLGKDYFLFKFNEGHPMGLKQWIKEHGCLVWSLR